MTQTIEFTRKAWATFRCWHCDVEVQQGAVSHRLHPSGNWVCDGCKAAPLQPYKMP